MQVNNVWGKTVRVKNMTFGEMYSLLEREEGAVCD